MRHLKILVAATTAAGMMASGMSITLKAAETKPNILFIMADDLGYADLSCYGAKKIKTPRIDQLAAEGMRFTDFYAAGNVCTPSRASLLTAAYPKRVGMHRGVIKHGHHSGLHPDETTVAELLRDAGYATACIGKWHLGEEPETMPLSHGFDSYFGMAAGNHRYSDLYRDNEVVAKNSEVDTSLLTRRYTEEALKFLRYSKDRPFFLYLSYNAIHVPLVASKEFQGKSAGEKYGDMTEEMDWSVGQVIDELDELGLAENTLVVFTSDNGPFSAAAPPLHGAKGSTWEGGHRVPCIARFPGKIPAGSVTDVMAILYDWPVTLAALAGTAFPSEQTIDGISLWPVLEGVDESTHDRAFVYYSRGGTSGGRASAVRLGRWKLHVIAPENRNSGKLPPEALADLAPSEPVPWLFDLESDVSETRNVADAYPEVVGRLRNELKRIDAEIDRTARPAFERKP